MKALGIDALHRSRDDWKTFEDTQSTQTSLGVEFVDIDGPTTRKIPVRFTFFWTQNKRWGGRDYEVALAPERASDIAAAKNKGSASPHRTIIKGV